MSISESKVIPKAHKLRAVWYAMKQRCHNPNNKYYYNYGGRGIFVCNEWRDSYVCFFEWAISNGYAVGKHIDRINNDLGYYPDNCRFISPAKSQRNKRNTKLIEYNGEKRTISEWAAYFDVSPTLLYSRIRYKKMPLDMAVSYKKKPKKSLITSESKTIGSEIKRIIKLNGRFNWWVIDKLKEAGFDISESDFSSKLAGQRDCFTNDEIEQLYKLFNKHNFAI